MSQANCADCRDLHERIAALTSEVERMGTQLREWSELILLLRNVVAASLHGDGQEKANAYAALQRYDRTTRILSTGKKP